MNPWNARVCLWSQHSLGHSEKRIVTCRDYRAFAQAAPWRKGSPTRGVTWSSDAALRLFAGLSHLRGCHCSLPLTHADHSPVSLPRMCPAFRSRGSRLGRAGPCLGTAVAVTTGVLLCQVGGGGGGCSTPPCPDGPRREERDPDVHSAEGDPLQGRLIGTSGTEGTSPVPGGKRPANRGGQMQPLGLARLAPKNRGP